MQLFKKMFDKLDEGVQALTRDANVADWLVKLEDAQKREKKWRQEGQRVVELYEQQRNATEAGGVASFNILYANTETLSPAVYNNTPRPVVKRKIDKENPVAIAAAQVLQKTLVFLTDSADRDYAPFDELQKSAVTEALVPGRGLARFTYHADLEEVPPSADELALNPQAKSTQRVREETVCGDSVPWNRVLYGYAKQAHKIPWMAYEHFMTREECVENFGEVVGKQIKLTHAPEDDKDGRDNQPADAEGMLFAHIWEIWDKATKKVLFVTAGYPSLLKEVEDPLKLEGFFNAPQPIEFLHRISSLVPQTLYLMYERQAKELEDVTDRIGHLTRAMKVRGFYDGTLEGLDQLLTKPENTLLPAQNVAAMQQGMSLDKAVWLMPIEKLITVLQQLYVNRTQVIGVIHQLTGVADIMRGSSAASETLGAQKMKEAWGTMRLKRMQKEVQRFTRDCFRIEAELAAKHFSIDTFVKATGLKFPRAQEKQAAQMELQQLMAQKQMLEQQAQQTQQPPDPATIKQGQEKVAQAQSILQQPSWEEIVDLIKSDSVRNYVIDIETNSTIDIEATEDKQELGELMNSLAQVLNGVYPMVEKGVMPFEPAKQLILSIITKFRMGDEVEETFRAMKQPPPQPDPKQEADKAAQAAEMQRMQAEMGMAKEQHGLDMQLKEADLNQRKAIAMLELEVKRAELELQKQEMALKQSFLLAKHTADMEILALKVAAAKEPPEPRGEV